MRRITWQRLARARACAPQLRAFRRAFSHGVTTHPKNAARIARLGLDYENAAMRLLTARGYQQFQRRAYPRHDFGTVIGKCRACHITTEERIQIALALYERHGRK